MIKKLLTTGCLVLMLGCHNNTDISVEQVKQLIKSGQIKDILLLDVRTKEEYADRHIPGSTSIPLDSLEEESKQLDKDKPIIVYCKSGCNRSLKACRILKDNGFERIKNMVGGIDEWQKIGGKIEGDEGTKTTVPQCKPVWEYGRGCED